MNIVEPSPQQQTNDSHKSSGIGLAVLGGGGVGTLMVAFAQLLPETSNWRGFLIIAAPVVSVAVGSLWFWTTAEIRKHLKEKDNKKTLVEQRKYLTSKIHDPDTSLAMRELYESQLKQLEEKSFAKVIKDLES